jgi:4-amino-4-deoxy-L-arabinose transferase-like glycosyltransferase
MTAAFAVRRPSRLAIALVLLALAVRLMAAVAVFDDPLAFDARDYDRYARSIATGNGYPEAFAPYGGPTAYRPPGFPTFLAGAYALRGGSDPPPGWRVYRGGYQPDQRQVNAGRIAQAFLGAAVVALIGVVAFQLFGARVALVSMGIAALYPPLVIAGLSLFSEPLFIAFVLAALAAALRARAGPLHVVRWAVLSGVLAGLAWLTRSNGFVLFPALCLLVWTATPRLSLRALAAPAAVLAAAALVVAPWTIRNAIELDAFFPVSSEGGYTLAGTYNATSANDPDYPAGWRPPEQDRHNARLIAGVKDEADLAATMTRSTLEYIGDHPAYVGKVAYCNTMRMLYLELLGCGEPGFGKGNFEHETRIGVAVVGLAMASFALLALLAIAGVATRAARAAPRALWLLPLLLATVVLVVPGNRLRAPIEPFLIMLAALALVSLAERVRPRTRS